MNNAVMKTKPVPLDKDGKVDWEKIDVGLEHDGTKIILPGHPAPMDYDTAISALKQMKKMDAQTYDANELIEGLPWDALVAFYRAIVEIYGKPMPTTLKTWFGDVDPVFITVKTGPDKKKDVVQVPINQYTLPGWKVPIMVGITMQGCTIAGKVNRKDKDRLLKVVSLARQFMETQSIYKGQAISINVTDKGELDLSKQPDFWDVADVHEDQMIHNRVTEGIIRQTLFSPIRHMNACIKNKIPLKRGVLLEGRYGCGKTLTARVTAKVAIDNGWTFVNLGRAQGLKAAIHVAQQLQPAVIFAEDIDRFADRTKEQVSDMINMMDGLVPAGAAIMTVMTTNFVERIDKALLRPGRLDAVISIDAPDAETVGRLIQHYGGDALMDDISLTAVGKILAGEIPATVAEVVKRAKLAMITEERSLLTENDLVFAGESMRRHLKLLADEKPEPSIEHQVGDRLAKLFRVTEARNAREWTADALVKIATAQRVQATPPQHRETERE